MVGQPIRFDNGDVYEQTMGIWSRSVGEVFLDWLAPSSALQWIDVGCGNGAFTELLIQRCAPSEAQGIDPSEAQLTFARTRPAARGAVFVQADAMALPFADESFDVAVMALVIFFVPDPVKGVAEMARVVRPGGVVAAYAWDMLDGGFPWNPIQVEMRAMGIEPLLPPRADISRMASLCDLWTGAKLKSVEARAITVERSFANFDDFWNTATMAASLRPVLDAMTSGGADLLKARVRAHLPGDADGRVVIQGRANAIKGRLPV
jgi:SAM-dependent methyltransferase